MVSMILNNIDRVLRDIDSIWLFIPNLVYLYRFSYYFMTARACAIFTTLPYGRINIFAYK